MMSTTAYPTASSETAQSRSAYIQLGWLKAAAAMAA
jgi:hypothetical protein